MREHLLMASGYDRKKHPAAHPYREMTRDEVLALRPGQVIEMIHTPNTVRNVRVNGRVRTWKRDPDRVEVPLKYGFRDTFVFSLREALTYLVVPVNEEAQA